MNDAAIAEELAVQRAVGPRYFGPAASPLFGWYHPAHPDVRRCAPVVLCPPVGYEAVCVFRAYRHLALRLAEAGSPVLRFDYHGAGDSSGRDADPDRLNAWLASIDSAIDEIKAQTGAHEVALFGTRLGATLAVAASARRKDVSSLLLVAPLTSGRLHVREVRAFRLMAEKELRGAPAGMPGREPGDEESAGFLLSADTVEALSTLDLLGDRRRPARRALVISRDDVPGNEQKLVRHFQTIGVEVVSQELAGYGAMMQDPHKSTVPEAILDQVVAFVAEESVVPYPPLQNETQRQEEAALFSAHGEAGDRVRELPLFLPISSPPGLPPGSTSSAAGRSLFAIATEPAQLGSAKKRDRPLVIFLNAGAVHRVGPNRMYVTLARTFAEHGLISVRLDLSGLGDSPAAPGTAENTIYSTDVVGDVRAAMRVLTTRYGAERFVLAGLCAGAYVSFHAGLADESVIGEVLINPQTFYFKPGDSLEIADRRTFAEARRYQRQLWNRESWKKALSGGVNFRHVFQVMVDRAGDLARAKARDLLLRIGQGEPEAIGLYQAFQTMEKRGVDTLMIFSGDDPGLDYLEGKLGHQLARLQRAPSLRLEVIDGPDHTFTPLWSQKRLADLITEHVLERYGR